MIPINKPLIFDEIVDLPKSTIIAQCKGIVSHYINKKNIYFTYSARNALNQIYKFLYNMHGSLRVCVSPLTCFEALYPIINNGHIIKFIDINNETLNFDENLLQNDCEVIQVIHLGGNPQKMIYIKEFCDKNNIILIEDCSQAFSSFYGSEMVGNFGDFSVFSLIKTHYTISGRLLVTNYEMNIDYSNEISKSIVFYKNLKRKIESKMSYKNNIHSLLHRILINSTKSKKNKYDICENELSLSIFKSIFIQLSKTEILSEKRKKNAKFLFELLNSKNCNFKFQNIIDNNSFPNYMRIYLLTNNSINVIENMRKKGIMVNMITQDSYNYHNESVSSNSNFIKYYKNAILPNYNDTVTKIISLPSSPNLKINEIHYIADTLGNLIN